MSFHTIQQPTGSNLNTIRSQQYPYKNIQKTHLTEVKSNTNSKLFYIKSKHTEKYFRNHNYFESKQSLSSNRKSLQNQPDQQQIKSDRKQIGDLKSFKKNKSLIISHSQIEEKNIDQNKQIINKQRMKQFVYGPPQFGIDNTYKYLKNKSFLRKSEHLISIKKSVQKQRQRRIYTQLNQNQNNDAHHYLKQTSSQEKRFMQTLKERKLSFANKKMQIQNLLYSQKSKNLQKKDQNSLNLNKIYNTQNLSGISHIKSHIYDSIQYNITFIYGVRIQNFGQIVHRKLCLNIFPFIINSFLKCKIKYQQFTAQDFQFIKNAIFKVIFTKKQHFDIKDIINIGSLKVLIKYLKQFQQTSPQWIQTIRYFFVAQQNILEYQLEKIKDQLRKLTALKFNAQLNSKQLFLYNIQNGKLVQTLFDVFMGKEFVFSDKNDVFNEFNSIVSKHKQINSLAKKINEWKNLAQKQSNFQGKKQKDIQNEKPNLKNNFKKNYFKNINIKISQQRFNNLFEQSKRRHSKSQQKDKPSLKEFIKSSEFINKHKLKKNQSFFE